MLPKYINVGILSRFLTPLIATGASALNLRMTLNGDQLTLDLVECLCGFFVQISITGLDELLDDIQNALPFASKLFHLDAAHPALPRQEQQTLLVRAFIPGGTSLTLSRDAVILCRHRQVHECAARKLKRMFADLSTLRFHVTSVHPTMEWIEPVMTPFMHYMIVGFDPPGSAFTSALVRIWMPPLVQVGAVHCHRSIDKITLLRQLRLLRLCGHDGDRCTCYIDPSNVSKSIPTLTGSRIRCDGDSGCRGRTSRRETLIGIYPELFWV